MANLLKFGARGTLTAFKFADGKITVTDEIDNTELPRWARKLLLPSGKPPAALPAPTELPAPVAPPKPVAAVTVTRPSMSCPECSGRPEKARMACDVLWEFLNESQRAEWLRSRGVTATGNRTGHTYRVHPRDSEAARLLGRCAWDIDDRVILHNFNRMVPPEEEMLGLLLMIQFCEEWVRVAGEVDPSERAEPGTIFPNTMDGVDYMRLSLDTLLHPEWLGMNSGFVEVGGSTAAFRKAILDPLDEGYDPQGPHTEEEFLEQHLAAAKALDNQNQPLTFGQVKILGMT